MAQRNGLNTHPQVIAELGPGDSLGIGLAALISGSSKYFAFDVVEHARADRNAVIFDELVTLFRNRAPIPGDDEFPEVRPPLDNYAFPSTILDDGRLRPALETSRVERIRASLDATQSQDSPVQYRVPWYAPDILQNESVDMIYSQAVLEHVDDLRATYRAMRSWLKATGYISHQIDFRCHGSATEWNGHWTYSDLSWRLLRGRRPYLLNRAPHSAHISALAEEGFEILCDKTSKTQSHLTRYDLAPRFRAISSDDLITSGAFIQAVKRTEGAK
jgi:hypothetical protein